MPAKRIIAALDVINNSVVKGINFENIKNVDNPVELAKRYEMEGIDEIVFLDITATNEKRNILKNLVKNVASEIYIPFTAGGGINSVENALDIIRNGADKIFINTYAIENPAIVRKLSDVLGSANTVVAIDAKYENNNYYVYSHGGKINTGKNVIEWAKNVDDYGAGEVLITSINSDGTMKGYDNNLIELLSNKINIPVIASGGAGKPEDFLNAFKSGADGALAASVFHYKKYSVKEIKNYLKENGINVRL